MYVEHTMHAMAMRWSRTCLLFYVVYLWFVTHSIQHCIQYTIYHLWHSTTIDNLDLKQPISLWFYYLSLLGKIAPHSLELMVLFFAMFNVLNPIQWRWIKTENQPAYCKLQDEDMLGDIHFIAIILLLPPLCLRSRPVCPNVVISSVSQSVSYLWNKDQDDPRRIWREN